MTYWTTLDKYYIICVDILFYSILMYLNMYCPVSFASREGSKRAFTPIYRCRQELVVQFMNVLSTRIRGSYSMMYKIIHESNFAVPQLTQTQIPHLNTPLSSSLPLPLSPALHHFKAFSTPTDTNFTEADRISKTAMTSHQR